MNSKQLIEQVNACRKNNWQNSDLGRNSEEMLEAIADHFETCEECRKQFDAQEYPEETLIDFEDNLSNTDLYNWICDERPIQQNEVSIEEIDYRNAEGYWKAGKMWEQMKNNEWMDGEKLTPEKMRELQNEYPDGFYLSGWRKDNDDSEADLYLTPTQTVNKVVYSPSSEYKYVTVGALRTIGENIELGEERLDDEEEVRLVSVAKTKDGEILVQVDVRDSYGTWDAHCDFDITLGMEDKEFFDIDSSEPFETYSGYGILLTKNEWDKI